MLTGSVSGPPGRSQTSVLPHIRRALGPLQLQAERVRLELTRPRRPGGFRDRFLIQPGPLHQVGRTRTASSGATAPRSGRVSYAPESTDDTDPSTDDTDWLLPFPLSTRWRGGQGVRPSEIAGAGFDAIGLPAHTHVGSERSEDRAVPSKARDSGRSSTRVERLMRPRLGR